MAVEAPTAPSTGALSFDQAVEAIGLLGDPSLEPVQDEQPAEPAAETENPEPSPEGEGGEEPVEANPAETEEEPPEPAEPAIEPPLFWTAEEKEAFKELPRHLQQKLVEKEDVSSKAVAKAMKQAADQRKAAEQAVQTFTDKAKAIDGLLTQAEAAALADGWGEWMQVQDAQWINLLRQDPDTYRPIKEQVDLRKSHLQQLITAKQDADNARQAETFNAHLAQQREELARIAPALASDGAKRAAIGQYLMDQGYAPERLKGIGAQDLVLAEKAMRWDQAQKAKASVKPQPKPAPASSKPVKPAASNPTPPKQRAAQELENRFAQTRSADDLVALLNSKG